MHKQKAVFILGLKWYDKVNGNTYHNAIIYFDDGSSQVVGYCYGYGDGYRYDAIEWLKANNYQSITGQLNTIPHAYKWTKKGYAKRGLTND